VGGLGSLISSFTSAFSGSFYASGSLDGAATETSSGKYHHFLFYSSC